MLVTSAICAACIEDTAGFQWCSDPTSAPSLPVRVYSVNFPTQLLGIGCERLRASGHAREGAANAALGPRRDGGRASGGVHQKAVVRLTVQADASGAYQGESDRHGEPKI